MDAGRLQRCLGYDDGDAILVGTMHAHWIKMDKFVADDGIESSAAALGKPSPPGSCARQ